MASVYENSYMIVLIFLLLGILLPVVALTLGRMLRPNKPSAAKATTYESGIEPFMMQIFGFMLVTIFLLYCLSSLM